MNPGHFSTAQVERNAPLQIDRRARNTMVDRRMSNQVDAMRLSELLAEGSLLIDRIRCRDHVDAKLLSGLGSS